MAEDNNFSLNIGIHLDNEGKELLDQWENLKKKIEDDKLDIGFGNSLNTTTESIKNTSKQVEELSKQVQNLNSNNDIKLINTESLTSQIENLKGFTGTVDEIKQKLSSLGEVKIKTGGIDDNGNIQNYIATVKQLNGELAQLKFKFETTFDDSIDLFKFDGIKSITDTTDKVIKKLEEFKTKYSEIIDSIGNKDLLPEGSINKAKEALDSLNENSNKLSFDNVKKQINDLSNQSNSLFKEQQANLQKVMEFVDRYNDKINSLYRNKNDGISNDQIMGLENKVNGLVGSDDTSQFRDIELEYKNLINLQDDYAKKMQETNQKIKEQESLLQYISSQQERLKNIQTNYTGKIDANSGLYGNLQNRYRNIFNLLDEYKEKDEQLSAEQKINITEQINDLKRLSNEYLNVNSFIKSQENALNNMGNKYKSVLNENEIESYKNSLKGFDPATENLIGDMNKIIEKHKQLKTELEERVRVQNLGENIGSLSGSGLNMNSGIGDVQKYIQSVMGAKASVSSITPIIDKFGNSVKVANVSLDEGHNIVSKYKVALDETSGSIRKLSTGEQDLSSKHSNLMESIGNSLSGFLRFQVIAVGVMEAINAVKEGIGVINQLNDSVTNISMVTGESTDKVKGYMDQYASLSSQLHTTTTDVATAAEEFLRAGDNQTESMQMVKASTVLSAEAGIEQKEAAQGLIAIANSYDILPNKIMSVVDAMTTVDNASATSVSELNTGLQKSASSAKEAGVPLQKLISYIGEISSVTRLPASTIGTGLNSIFSRFSSIKMGKNYDPTSGEEISLNNVEKSLKTVGIAIRSDKDTFKSFSDVLDQVGSKWGNFTDRQKNLISTQLAGTYQRNSFMALMNHYTDSLKLEQKETDSAGSAMDRYSIKAQSTGAKIKDLEGSIQKFWQQTINSNQINGAIGEVNNLVNTFSSLTNKFGIIPTLLAGIVPILTQFKKFSDFKPIDFTSSIGSIKMFNKEVLNLMNSEGKIEIFGNTLSQLKEKMKNLPTTYLDSYTKNLRDIQGLNNTMMQTPTILERASASMETLRLKTVATTVATGVLKVAELALDAAITMGLSLAIGYVVEKLGDYIDRVDTLKQKNQDLLSSTQQSIQNHQSNVQSLTEMAGKYKEVSDRIQAYKDNGLQPTADDTKSLADMNDQLGQKFPSMIQGYTDTGHAILNLNGNLTDLINKEKEASRWDAQKVINSSGFKDEAEAMKQQNNEYIGFLNQNQGFGNPINNLKMAFTHPIKYVQSFALDDSQRAKMTAQLNKENAESDGWYKQIIPKVLQLDSAYQKLSPILQKNVKTWADQNTAFSKMKGTDVQKQIGQVTKMYSDTTGTLPLINQINKLNTQAKTGAVPLKQYTKETDDLIDRIKKVSGTNLSTSQLKSIFNIDTSKLPKTINDIKTLDKSLDDMKADFKTNTTQIKQYQKVLDDIQKTGKLSDKDKKIIQEDPDLQP